MASYVTIAELKASQELHGTTYADHDLSLALEAASRAVEQRCARVFTKAASASARYYSPSSAAAVPIDDAVSVSELAIDVNGDGQFAVVASTEYVLWPWNAAAVSEPYTRIQLRLPSSTVLPWWIPRSARVTAVWGWPSVPDAFRQAVMLLAARLLKRSREAPFGVTALGLDVGAAARIASVDPDVTMLTDPYVRLVGPVQ